MVDENVLVFNFLLDLRKKEITPQERSKIIQNYLNNTGKSMRGLAKELGINQSTIQDWISMRQIKNKGTRKNNEIFTLANRLNFLLNKNVIDDKARKELNLLRDTIDKTI